MIFQIVVTMAPCTSVQLAWQSFAPAVRVPGRVKLGDDADTVKPSVLNDLLHVSLRVRVILRVRTLTHRKTLSWTPGWVGQYSTHSIARVKS